LLFWTVTVWLATGEPPVVKRVYECDGASQSNGAAVAPVAAPGVGAPPSTLSVVPDAFCVLQFNCTVGDGQLAAGGPMNDTMRGTGGVVVVVVVEAVVDVVDVEVDDVDVDDVELEEDVVVEDDDDVVLDELVVESSLWVASAIPTPASTPTTTTIPPIRNMRRRRPSSSLLPPAGGGAPAPPPLPEPAAVVGIARVASTGGRDTDRVTSDPSGGAGGGSGVPGTARVGSSGLVIGANYATAIAWKARSSRSTSGPPAA
jgi:hypothetical protein